MHPLINYFNLYLHFIIGLIEVNIILINFNLISDIILY